MTNTPLMRKGKLIHAFKKVGRLVLAYFCIFLVAEQVIANVINWFYPSWYQANAFGLNLAIGCNIQTALFLVLYTFTLRFCYISRACAVAELGFALAYYFIKEDNLYNQLVQVIGGLIALLFTVRSYSKLFPVCHFSMFVNILKHVAKERSCGKGLDKWYGEFKTAINERI